MSDKPRRYVEYRYVTLLSAVEAPPRNLNATGFSGDEYRFFFEGPMLGIECRRSGVIIHVPITGIRVARCQAPAVEASSS